MTSRPNILQLFVDQQRFDTIRALGNPIISTPNLDRLVAEGTAFEKCYTPSAECVPARNCMLTGLYTGRTGCFSNAEVMSQGPTFVDRLTQAGYRTHGIGKCHFTPDRSALRGFETRESQEENVESLDGDDYSQWLIEQGLGWVIEPHGVRGEMYYTPQVSLLPEQNHPTRWVGDRSVHFIEEQGRDSRPWYLYAGFIHPHPPFAPPVPWHKMYRAPEMPLPDLPSDVEKLLFFINRFQNRYKYRDRGLDLNLIRCMRAYYYACISFIDAQIGRILETLEKSGQLENTLIVFTSDHGEYLGDFGCFGKRGMHEASSRVPLIVRWPGAKNASLRYKTPVNLVDLAPTFLEAAGVSIEKEEMDGESLLAVAENKSSRTTVFSQYNHRENGLYMAVESRWKYVYSAPDQREYLFDLVQDPREHTDLAGGPMHLNVLNDMRQRCHDWVRRQGVEGALEGDHWKSYPRREMPVNPDAGLIFQDPAWWVEEKKNAGRK